MKAIRPIYIRSNKKSEKIALLVFIIIFCLLIGIASVVSAQVSFNNPFAPNTSVTTAEDVTNSAIIKWSATTDSNYHFFLLERTQDKVHYEFVSAAKTKGIENSMNMYSVADYTPLKGKTYYRVSKTDFKGNSVPLFEIEFSKGQALAQK